jgi:predicted XRE-type DNA-binding protein
MSKRTFNGEEFELSSGNVYADLGLPNAEELYIKSGLAITMMQTMRRLGLTQQQAAVKMGISQAKISALTRGDFTNLSEPKLMQCLNRLGYDIEIKVKPAKKPVGRRVLATA